MHFDYSPPPTLARFMRSNAYGRFVTGPVGSGKTTAAIMELLRRAAEQAPALDGKRYTRFAIIRNTLLSLKQTTLKDIQELLAPIVNYKVSENTITIRAGDIVSEWFLIPLEDQEDQRRLLSMQLTGAFIEEAREVRFDLVPALSGRVGRYPSRKLCPDGATWKGIICVSNPFSVGSAWHTHLVAEPMPGWELFRQPSGLSAEAENVENLPENYYQTLAATYSHDPEWIRVHIHGEWGADPGGAPVFASIFRRDLHATRALEPLPAQPLVVGVDVGRNAAAVLCQPDARGRLIVLDELCTPEDGGVGLETFIEDRLLPKLNEGRYIGLRRVVVVDPAAGQRSQLNELTAFDVLRDFGLNPTPAPTNALAPRLGVIEHFLRRTEQFNGKLVPWMVVDEERCPVLIRAFQGEYKFKRSRLGSVDAIPEKKHPVSDVMDALGYAALATNGTTITKAVERQKRLDAIMRARMSGEGNAGERKVGRLGWT